MQSRDEKKKQRLILSLIGGVIVFCVALHFAAISAENPGMNIVTLLESAMMSALTKPWNLITAFKHGAVAFKTAGIAIAVYSMVAAYLSSQAESRETYPGDKSHGSAHWNSNMKKYNHDYVIKRKAGRPDMNMHLAKGLKYGLKAGKNCNAVVMGSAGSGKSFCIIKPNLMQMNTSFVITDPSGEMFRAEAKMLLEHGYVVKVFSTSDMVHSNCYNPFDYIYSEDGEIDETRVSSMVHMFLQNAAEGGQKGGDKFWDQASKALLTACAMLLLEFYPVEKRNMYEMLRLVQKGKTSEKDAEAKTELDKIFEEARRIKPDAHCFSSYDTFKLAPARTANSILISAAVDLNMFNITKVRNMTTTAYQVKSRNLAGQIRSFKKDENGNLIRSDDNIDLRTVGDEKTCIFINIPQADGTYNFLVSMMYSQMFEALYGRAEKICPKKYMINNKYGDPVVTMIDSKKDAKELIDIYKAAKVEETKDGIYIVNKDCDKRFWLPGKKDGKLKKVYSKDTGKQFLSQFEGCKIAKGKGRLPWHVQCLLDEFANIGQIPEFPQKLATMRKYEISCIIVLQSLSQLKAKYDKLYNDILSNCGITIFLGSQDPDTDKYISELCGKTTIRVDSTSRSTSSKGGNSSKSINKQVRDLITIDEVSTLDTKKAIVRILDQHPFLIQKAAASAHENWNLTGDGDPSKVFEISEFTDCTEKALSKRGDAFAAAENMQMAISNVNANNKPAVQNPVGVHNPIELAASLGVNVSSAAEAAKKVMPVPKPTSPIEQGFFDFDDADIPSAPSSRSTAKSSGASKSVHKRGKK